MIIEGTLLPDYQKCLQAPPAGKHIRQNQNVKSGGVQWNWHQKRFYLAIDFLSHHESTLRSSRPDFDFLDSDPSKNSQVQRTVKHFSAS